MNGRILAGAVTILALGIMFGGGSSVTALAAATITVDCTAAPNALASALAGANDGDTLAIQGTCKGSFEIAHSVTLAGSGEATLDGEGAGTVVTIDPGQTVNVTGLRITGGSTDLYTNGGGIVNNGGSLTLDTATVSGNASGYQGNGGGIFNSGAGTVELIQTTVTNNTTSLYANGAGIYNDGGTLQLTDSTVTANTTGYAGNGGGIYSNGGTLTLTNSAVSNNTASMKAGGIYGVGTLTLTGSAVAGNTSSFDGGAASSRAAEHSRSPTAPLPGTLRAVAEAAESTVELARSP
jgi:nitrous oxidase accessory protein NosD